jgi:conjugative relaxase-like TrwC/TraI family protein
MPGRARLRFFVLTAKAQYNLANAETYFREHLSTGDYYSQGKQVAGEWFGEGAKRIGLQGAVQLDDFLKLCRNINPRSDERLTQRQKTNRRVFYDFTLSPPKSVSVVALVTGNRRIEEAHERATLSALHELQRFAAARVRMNRASTHRNTGNIVSAIFRHDTSRALDPHLHCHCIIFNATHDRTEDRWKALETYEMLHASKFAENVYYHELAQELRHLGYEIQNNRRGDFEIGGVTQTLIDTFSKRHTEIDEKTRELLENAPEKQNRNIKDIREHVAHKERARKIKDIGRAKLIELWEKQISADEKADLSQLAHGRQRRERDRTAADVALAWAEEHLFDRRSVVNEFELWRHALERGRGQGFSLKDLQRLMARRPYIRNAESPGRVTTRETLNREQRIITAARRNRGAFQPLNAKHEIKNAALDPEQRQAVERILASRDFVTLFRGGAGTGKSFTLKEIRNGLLAGGRSAQVIAPQRQQVLDLQRDLSATGATVSEFLTRRQMDCGGIVIVDEAGQIGSKQMLQLFELVRKHNGRIILSGDTKQHGPVEASDALRAIEKYAGLQSAELTTIRRQNPNLAKTKEERRTIEEYRLAVDEARNGALRKSFDRLNHNRAVTQCGLFEQQELLTRRYLELAGSQSSIVVVSQTWSEIHRVNDAIREGLKKQNLIGREDVKVASLQRLDLTDAQKRDERFYSENSVIVFNQDAIGFKKGMQARLLKIADQHLIIEANSCIRRLPFKLLKHISVCEPQELAISPGDRLQLKANATTKDGKHIANGELVNVKNVREDGAIELQDGRVLDTTYRQFVRGYAVTSYAAQGKTADYVLFSDSAIRAATNQKQWYVTISRGRKGIEIFTTDKRELRENVIRSGNRELAMEIVKESRRTKRSFDQAARSKTSVSVAIECKGRKP